MTKFVASKLLAGIGSVLLLIPGLNIVGIFFMLLGMKGLADYYKDSRIYRNAIIGVIFGIIGLISISMSMIYFLITVFFRSTITENFNSTGAAVSYVPNTLLILVAFIFISLMALFLRKAFRVLSTRSGVRLFRAAGLLLFIGAIVPVLCISLAAVLQIISLHAIVAYDTHTLLVNTAMLLIVFGPFVGLFLVYVTFVLLVVAFFSLKSLCLNAPTTNAETKYCARCEKRNTLE